MPDFKHDLVALLPKLRRFAMALSHSQHDAEDLVQMAVERALQHQQSWQSGTSLQSWLYRIIQNLWRDELRAHRRRAQPLDDAMELVGEDGREISLHHIQCSEAQAAFETLPEEQRMVLVMVVLDGMSYKETSVALEVPIGTVMSRLARARAGLAERLDERTRMKKTSR